LGRGSGKGWALAQVTARQSTSPNVPLRNSIEGRSAEIVVSKLPRNGLRLLSSFGIYHEL
jgi:hypothetical protein